MRRELTRGQRAFIARHTEISLLEVATAMGWSLRALEGALYPGQIEGQMTIDEDQVRITEEPSG